MGGCLTCPVEEARVVKRKAAKRAKTLRKFNHNYGFKARDFETFSCDSSTENLAELASRGGHGQHEGDAAAHVVSVAQGAAALKAGRRSSIELKTACVSRPGREPGYRGPKVNQDSCFAYERYAPGVALFAALDGHGPEGHHVANFVKVRLPALLAARLARPVAAGAAAGAAPPRLPEPWEALAAAFRDVDGALAVPSSRIDAELSGCTAVVAYVEDVPLDEGGCGNGCSVPTCEPASATAAASEAIATATKAGALQGQLSTVAEEEETAVVADLQLVVPAAAGADADGCTTNNTSGATTADPTPTAGPPKTIARLTVAWVGDSRCVIGRAAGAHEGAPITAVEVTSDHKPAQPAERARILASNGRVERLIDEAGRPVGPHRVWLPDAWFPGLAVSRAIGDGLAQGVGVTPEPDTVALALTGLDRFIVLASDGVWEFVSCQEAVDIVARAGGCPEAGANALANASVKRWMAAAECGRGGVVVDDVTVVVVALRPGGGDGAGHSAAAVKRAARRSGAGGG